MFSYILITITRLRHIAAVIFSVEDVIRNTLIEYWLSTGQSLVIIVMFGMLTDTDVIDRFFQDMNEFDLL